MQKLIKSLRWIDENLLKILVSIYIFLMPLYPKLPLFNVNYTYVAIRLEDIFMGVLAAAFVLQFIRRKVNISKKFLIVIGLFWIATFISFYYGAYILKTVVIPKVGLLHALRRLEYMIVFFIVAATVKTKKDFYYYLKLIFITLAIVTVYGIGQKFLGWPAVQTMNPEYAKGYLLFLDSFARVSSTFAGHYDLAAYLVLLIPVVLGMYIIKGNKLYFLLFVLSLIIIILSASRVSYGAYILSTVALLLFLRKFKLLIVVVTLTLILTPLSDNLTKRITRAFRFQKIYIDPQTNKVYVPRDSRPDDLPPGDFIFGDINTDSGNSASGDKSKDAINARIELRSTIVKEAEKQGKKLTDAEIDAEVERTFGGFVTQNKFISDISQSTRFQVEWPRAINAFMKSPIVGAGPSSITEATDNDYLRWLGELGLLGTGLFLTIIFMVVKTVYRSIKNWDKKEQALFYSFIFGLGGLLINATYIDVFEASKVAYVFWLVAGLFVAASQLEQKIIPDTIAKKPSKQIIKKKS